MTQLGLFPPAREVSPASEWCQRWTAGRHSWRRSIVEPAFRPERYAVEPLSEKAARAYVVANHYSRSYPAALQRYGLWDGGRLVGVAVLGVPTSAQVLTNVLPTCEPYRESALLGPRQPSPAPAPANDAPAPCGPTASPTAGLKGGPSLRCAPVLPAAPAADP